MRNSNVNMLSGSVAKGLLCLTLPIMVMNVVQNLLSIIDLTLLGNWVGDHAVGAVGASTMLSNLCTCLLIGLSFGANILVAKHMGEQNDTQMKTAANTAMGIAVGGGLLLMLFGLFCARPLLQLTNCPAQLLDDATLYFRLYFVSVPFLMLYTFSAALLRAVGDTKRPMYFLLLSSLLKVTLNILFIKVFHMDVAAMGYATILSNMVAAGLCLLALRRSLLQFRFHRMQLCLGEIKHILHIGIPTGLQNACYALANVVIATAVNGFGPDATTGISIANQIDGLLYYICLAPSLAIGPYMAQNLGAHNIRRARKALGCSIGITGIIGGVLGIFFTIFSQELASIMTSSPGVMDFACQKIMIAASTYFLCGINEVMSSALRSLGKPMASTVSTLLFLCLLRFVWVYAIFPLQSDSLSFLYLVWPIGWALSILFLLAIYFPTVTKLQKQHIRL